MPKLIGDIKNKGSYNHIKEVDGEIKGSLLAFDKGTGSLSIKKADGTYESLLTNISYGIDNGVLLKKKYK